MLKVTIKFYGCYKYKGSSKRRIYRLRKERFLTQLRNDPVLVPALILEPSQPTHPATLSESVPTVVAKALIKQTKGTIHVLQALYFVILWVIGSYK